MFTPRYSWNIAKVGIKHTGTRFILKIYAPSSSLLQGKHLPFSPSPLRINIFRLFVILSLTHYIVTLPRYFSFRLPHLNISTGLPSDKLDKNSQRMWLIKNFSEWNGYNHFRFALDFSYAYEFSRPAMCSNATWSSPLKCKVSL